MVRSHIVEITKEQKIRSRGDYDFVQLPSPGDRITLDNDLGDLEMVRVLRIKHVPIPVPAPKQAGHTPIVRVYVEWVDKWNDEP